MIEIIVSYNETVNDRLRHFFHILILRTQPVTFESVTCYIDTIGYRSTKL